MHYHDPARPKISFKLAYLSRSGRPIAPLPQLSIWPKHTDFPHQLTNQVTVGMWLLNSPMGASLYSLDIPLTDLPVLVLKWTDDPERFLWEMFQYDYEPHSTPLRPFTQPQLSLTDLGLDFSKEQSK